MKRKIAVMLMVCTFVLTTGISASLAADDTIHIALTTPITGDYAEIWTEF